MREAQPALRYAYFPGCSARGSCSELDVSTRAVAEVFGIRLEALESPGCTGAREFRAISERLHLAANGRILALAEATGRDLVVVCDTCLLNLVETNERLKGDARARAEVNRALAESGLEYRGATTVKHFLWVLLGDVGVERLRDKVVRPLRGLRVGPFYGCHILRPASVHGIGRSDEMSSLERLCEVLGAEPVAYEGATKCCGFHVLLAEEKVALRMSGGHLARARDGGADCLVTPCPLCHTVLDACQPDIERELKRPLGLPILHVSQLVGLAIGLSPAALGIPRHVVDARGIARAVTG
jgi:succinate dehydrogenase / fumarate reductase cytochrome b subunit